jgi:hypothetical protein
MAAAAGTAAASNAASNVAVAKFRQTFRDSVYFVIDIIPTIMRRHAPYGAFQKYISGIRRGKSGGVKHDEFENVDSTELHRMVDMYQQVRGPLTGFDMRYFYYVYFGMIAYVVWTGFTNFGKSNPALQSEASLEERRKQFSKDYTEEYREPPPSLMGAGGKQPGGRALGGF